MTLAIPNTAQKAVSQAFREAMLVMLKGLAANHGGKDGKWLDALEAEAIRSAKAMPMQSPNFANEATLWRISVEAIEGVFRQFRIELAEQAVASAVQPRPTPTVVPQFPLPQQQQQYSRRPQPWEVWMRG